MSHTPGPWRVVETNAAGEEEFYILPGGDEPGIAQGHLKCGRRIEDSRANAHLIAAAPDLLAACKAALGESMVYTGAVYETLLTSGLHTQLRDQLLSAIAKSEENEPFTSEGT